MLLTLLNIAFPLLQLGSGVMKQKANEVAEIVKKKKIILSDKPSLRYQIN